MAFHFPADTVLQSIHHYFLPQQIRTQWRIVWEISCEKFEKIDFFFVFSFFIFFSSPSFIINDQWSCWSIRVCKTNSQRMHLKCLSSVIISILIVIIVIIITSLTLSFPDDRDDFRHPTLPSLSFLFPKNHNYHHRDHICIMIIMVISLILIIILSDVPPQSLTLSFLSVATLCHAQHNTPTSSSSSSSSRLSSSS